MHIFFSDDFALAKHSFDTTKKSAWVAEAVKEQRLSDLKLAEPAPLSFEELTQVHAREYVAAVKEGAPAELAESQGFCWDRDFYRSVCASNGGAVAAAVQALKEGVAGSLSSGLHHARQARGAGFCTFNGLVLAARRAMACGAQNILILDLDAHCGGGTYSLVTAEQRVAHIDIAVSAFDEYQVLRPLDSLELVRDADRYLKAIAAALEKASCGSFDLCIYNAGVDPCEDCRIGGLPGIKDSMLEQRDRLVFEWCRKHTIPVAFVLAGGYAGPDMSRRKLVDLHLATIRAARRAWRGQCQ